MTDRDELRKRVADALEREYRQAVYLNHVNVQGDTVHVEFKTGGGIFGLASFRFTGDALVRLA